MKTLTAPALTTAAALLALASPALAAEAPFLDTFSTDSSADYIIRGATPWTVTDGQLVANLAPEGDNGRTDAVLNFSNIDTTPGTVITLSTDVEIFGDSGDTTRVGFTFFGDADLYNDADGAAPSLYRLQVDEPGGFDPPSLTFGEFSGAADADASDASIAADFTDLERTATLSAEITLGAIGFTGTFTATSEEGVSTTLNFADDTPLAYGPLFGVVADTFSGSTNSAIGFDNFAVTVTPIPEPASAALLAAGGALLLTRRRGA